MWTPELRRGLLLFSAVGWRVCLVSSVRTDVVPSAFFFVLDAVDWVR